jgi:hypothetical protein
MRRMIDMCDDSAIGRNTHHCANVFGFSPDNLILGLIFSEIVDKHCFQSLSSLDLKYIVRTLELILVRDGFFVLNDWKLQDISS